MTSILAGILNELESIDPDDWYELGSYLRIPYHELEKIDRQRYTNKYRPMIEVVYLWLKIDPNANWTVLAQAKIALLSNTISKKYGQICKIKIIVHMQCVTV